MTSNASGEISPILNSISSPDREHLRRSGAAKDFEALLIGQMLRSVREESSGWLGTGDDQSSSAAFGLGEEQLARALTTGGGLGLSRVIETGLSKQTTFQETSLQAISR